MLISGDRLRLLHDNPSLVKPAYLAADLELLIEGERFDEFSVLWLLLHASRFQHPQTGSCVLDSWKQKAEASGERVLGALRGGVQAALQFLGSGFLNHPANSELRDALFKHHTLSKQHFHEQLLRLVYRFLFLFTAEDRDLLFPREVDKGDPRRRIYREGYSVSRLRELAIKRSAYEGDYGDLWVLQRLVFQQLSIGNSPLGLPGLGGLFSLEQCPDLQGAELWNGPLLRAIKAIGWFDAGGTFTRVRYRDLNTEELGSVYEGLLELHPQLEQQGSQWQLSYGGGAGSDRKTTGSYYTPDALVQELIKSALVPVIEDRLSKEVGAADQEKALLNIKVIDPACGSGHFLLAAARRLAVALAQVRAGDDQPSEDDRQHALRDVVAHCIYAVDKNPMAVELCKVALWIEAIDPGKPLSFLDAHIQCGDSLVGVFDPKVLVEGIPDEAYKQLTGDDKTVCSSLKKENAAARKNNSRRGSNRGIQGSFDLSGAKPRSRSQEALQAIEAMPEATLAESAAKQAAYANWLGQSGQDPEALAADLFTAAFFLAKTSGSRATVPTTEHLLRLLGGQPVEEAMEEAVAHASQSFRFFHWHLRFGEVMARGGFDCVLGNPPWETISPNIKEWFSTYDQTIKSSSPIEQEQIQKRLLENLAIRKSWDSYCDFLSRLGEFIKESGRFSLFPPGNLGKGNMNLYRFFTELATKLSTRHATVVGLIIPDHLYLGASAYSIRKELIEKRGKLYLRAFENSGGVWFPTIHRSTRFCLFTSVMAAPEESLNAAFGLRTLKSIPANARGIDIPTWMCNEFGGSAFTIPEVMSEYEVEIIQAIHSAYTSFQSSYQHFSASRRPYSQELNTGSNKLSLNDTKAGLPVIEGRMITNYDYRTKIYNSGKGRSSVWIEAEFSSAEKALSPQWYITPEHLNQDSIDRIARFRIGFCDVANSTNQRSLTAALIPPGCICGHKVPTISIPEQGPASMMLTLGICNSLITDFLVKKKVSLTLSFTIMDSLPIPIKHPSSPAEQHLTVKAASLMLVGEEMAPFATSFASEIESWPCSEEFRPEEDVNKRLKLAAEIDAIYAFNILRLSRAQLGFILKPKDITEECSGYEPFGALERAEIRRFGEYRTQRLVLEAWDRLFGG
ncbi:N-6 DNA methylase [Cyanobium sp. WKJ7-Wakatipu]|uniref:Eco57I restriction-modification methylase domain-containing protein n=1 Tax=Cyanobium sp. WKJ7-Wakatipu TaxID=2823726 RepID=UPI0020CD47F3|nr:N-6 DNA methylase [Cyanobium sp. WKJ7-Wakatipu]MCP9782234.1 N-6 DNA methylase [Cyanobium sp. WKJ7-Wakatipu]